MNILAVDGRHRESTGTWICLTVGNRGSYSQQKGGWIGQKCPAQLVTMSWQGEGF